MMQWIVSSSVLILVVIALRYVLRERGEDGKGYHNT